MDTEGLHNPADKTLRVLVAKAGLDGHDRGAKVVVRALEDAGVGVFYTGLHQTPSQIVEAAITNQVRAIGISVLSGAHETLFPEVIELLKSKGREDIVVFGGGVIPQDDIPTLINQGVKAVFTPGTPLSSLTGWVIENLR
jgi:methylmalonyl-CoA mutase C-terminal domain/subunit